MDRRQISSGSRFEEEIGYSRAVVCDGWVFLSGCTGVDYRTMTLASGVEAQVVQALSNIRDALREAGADFDDVVRVTYVLPDRSDFKACWPYLRDAFGRAKPAAMMIEAGLIDPDMKLEIEVTARIPA